jgi:hypothetical protein
MGGSIPPPLPFVPCTQSLLCIPTKPTQYVKYIYLSPIKLYLFRCTLRHLQEDICDVIAHGLYGVCNAVTWVVL